MLTVTEILFSSYYRWPNLSKEERHDKLKQLTSYFVLFKERFTFAVQLNEGPVRVQEERRKPSIITVTLNRALLYPIKSTSG